ncbi:MAG TPA: DUF2461 domain-containing protein [Clostridiales bacterium]|jgi:uncharacterized protein (TIGR02453 family)|nr:DUF2461 domain-containing protein [Clostridiales bacterium]
MNAIFSKDMLEFMLDLRFNNNKTFMNENRTRYQEVMRDPYYRLIELLTPTALEIDPGMEVRPYKCLSRIFRDTRFSNNKLPYRDHHWVAFRHQAEPRDQAVMLWFEIRLDEVSWGLGFWGGNIKAMDVLRRQMVAKQDELLSILPILKKHHFNLEGSVYKRKQIPDKLPDALIPWYIRRDVYLVKQNINPEWVFEPGLEKRLSRDFLALKPFYQMLRGAYEVSALE